MSVTTHAVGAFPPGPQLIDGAQLNAFLQAFESGAGHSVSPGLTAAPGGTQASAFPLPAAINYVSGVITAGDSVGLPPAVGGQILFVANGAYFPLNVWAASSTEQINGSATVPFSLPGGRCAIFCSPVAGVWYSILSSSAASATLSLAASAYPNASVTGTLTETNLASIRIPAGSMSAQGYFRLSALWSYTNNANTKTLIERFGLTQGAITGGPIATANVTTTASTQWMQITRMIGTTYQQATYGVPAVPFGNSGNALSMTSVDTLQDTYINLNGQLTNVADTITLNGYTIEVFR